MPGAVRNAFAHAPSSGAPSPVRTPRRPRIFVDVSPTVDALIVCDVHVGEEDLVESFGAVDLLERTHLDARSAHVDDERGDAAVLRRFRIGARDDEAPFAVVRARRPDLLSVENPVAGRR